MTVFASDKVSARSVVDTRGSLNQPSVLNADAGLRYVSKPRLRKLRSSPFASPKSKKPLYGTLPTTGNHQVKYCNRSRYAAESTSTSVSCSSGEYVVKLFPTFSP